MVTTMDLYILALVDIIAEAVSIFFKSYYFFSFPYGIVIKNFFFFEYKNVLKFRAGKKTQRGLLRFDAKATRFKRLSWTNLTTIASEKN